MSKTSIEIKREYVMLCEGKADNAFFRKLCEHHGLAEPDFPFPPDGDPELAQKQSGRDGFAQMLVTLNAYFELYPDKKARVKGVLLAADAHDDPAATFQHVQQQVRTAGKFSVPNGLLQVAPSTDAPPLAILTVPGQGRRGGLETLCVDYLRATNPSEASCLNAYLECCPSRPGDWGAEKSDKVRFSCLVAVTYRANPGRATSLCFSRFSGVPPAVDVAHSTFQLT